MHRTYQSRLRKDNMEANRQNIVDAARSVIDSGNSTDFSLELVAKTANVSRVTVYNLFKSKSALIHAVCDRVSNDGEVFDVDLIVNISDPWSALSKYVDCFANLYYLNRSLFRRFRAVAEFDREFAKVYILREDRKRADGLTRILRRLHGSSSKRLPSNEEIDSQALMLKALLCFEVFDTLFESNATLEVVKVQIQTMVLCLVKTFLPIAPAKFTQPHPTRRQGRSS
jgi:AcrR family transcriptional regulator